MRAALAAPLVLVALRAAAAGWVSPPHAELLARAQVLSEATSVSTAVDLVYPPVPTLVALVARDAVGLAVVASFFAAFALHSALERMTRRRIPGYLRAALMLSVVMVPSAWYLATQDLATIGGLALLVMALEGFVRFAFAGETEGGFTAGLLLAAAFLFDPVALVYAFVLALAAPLLAWARHDGIPAATRATMAVLCMPTFALAAAVVFLQWRFTDHLLPWSLRELGLFEFPEGVAAGMGAALAGVGVDLLHSPVYLAVGAQLVVRKPLAGLGYTLPVAGLVLTHWMGFQYSHEASVLLLAFLGMVTAPYRPQRWFQALLLVAAVAQLVVNVRTDVVGWL